ncbi:hypothetical protein PGTUg99_017369 [Puccinia graminis f. sp. tritici]|uniref:Uncharacterized protein n=1 Tax=Puccinia graminis f. sp. tritici TaxID=56615 RepID=A0A5B0NXJ1_PUCGR|nr:hypothetical protein PGTUg99_017369 [Puccinia graminis f. sp. tritici]
MFRRASELGCSTKEQESNEVATCAMSSDVNDVTGIDKNVDHDQSPSSSLHSHKTSQRKLITRIFPPIVDLSNK